MALTCEGVIKSSKSVNWRAPLKPAAILFLFVLPLVNRGLLHWPSLQSSVGKKIARFHTLEAWVVQVRVLWD